MLGVGVGVSAGFWGNVFGSIDCFWGNGLSGLFPVLGWFICLSKSACSGFVSSSKRAYVPVLPFFSNCLPSSFIKLVVVLSPPSFVPRFNTLLFIAAPTDVTAPKIPPPTFFNLSLAFDAASLL